MKQSEYAPLFTEAMREGEIQEIIKTYRNKIDAKAFSKAAMATYSALVEKRPPEKIVEQLMEDLRECIVPRGELTVPEFLSLLESLGNVFLIYIQKKDEYAAIQQLDNSTKHSKNSASTSSEQQIDYERKTERVSTKWWQFWK